MLLAASLGQVDPTAAKDETPQNLPAYVQSPGVAGTIAMQGSAILGNLMAEWVQAFRTLYPETDIQIQSSGSSSAWPALTQATADLVLVSAPPDAHELQAFEAKFGYRPTAFTVASDAVTILAHRDNPIQKLSLQQLDAVFSETRRCGSPQDITTWGQLGLRGAWQGRRIELIGSDSASGDYTLFSQRALCGGDLKRTVVQLPGPALAGSAVAQRPGALGFAAMGEQAPGVKRLKIGPKPGGPFIAPTPKTVDDGSYPLARFLSVYVNQPPGKTLPPNQRELLKMILSREGQKTVTVMGFVPLSSERVAIERQRLQ